MFGFHFIMKYFSLYKKPGTEYLEFTSKTLYINGEVVPLNSIKRFGVSLGKFYVVRHSIFDYTINQSIMGYDRKQLHEFINEINEGLNKIKNRI